MIISDKLNLKSSFIYGLYREYHGHKTTNVLFNTAIDIVENYINYTHLLRCYTDCFTNYTGKITDCHLRDMLIYCRLYHLYIPCKDRVSWNYNVYYMNFYTNKHKTLFFLKYNYPCAKTNDSELYSEFLKSYQYYAKQFK
jgi:hypothetical protein